MFYSWCKIIIVFLSHCKMQQVIPENGVLIAIVDKNDDSRPKRNLIIAVFLALLECFWPFV